MNTRVANLTPSQMRSASRVAIRRVANYQAELVAPMVETLREFDLPIRGKTILLKPNFVGPDPQNLINTHPAVVAAARESFLKLGAEQVLLGDGPALDRDTEGIAESMHLRDFVGPLTDCLVDLNTDAPRKTLLRTNASTLKHLYFPETVLGADLVVSMPRMKTHHWAGVTLSLKNMFGVVPGNCYGWPKNILHWAGITRSLLDINATVRPDFAIVDGIVGMEGNGPTQGTAKPCGVLVMGDDPVAVDATCTRIMGLVPEQIEYLAQASILLGHVREEKISQIGETIAQVLTPFEVLENFKKLRKVGKTIGN
ncbi:MAG TPA: DUF362 domain-containing protein [Candidatus Saccharimonadales bacterium]|jgi:uncharacterized protein (DUF362 family)|nr:DUF362 domain-containing protein [Candidatus Saccharimonadales bacterium]